MIWLLKTVECNGFYLEVVQDREMNTYALNPSDFISKKFWKYVIFHICLLQKNPKNTFQFYGCKLYNNSWKVKAFASHSNWVIC